MRQTGHWEGPGVLTEAELRKLIALRIDRVDIGEIRREVEPFVKDPGALAIWSKEFFLDVASRIKVI